MRTSGKIACLVLFFLVVVSCCFAQGARKDDISLVNNGGIAYIGTGSTVRVCTQPASGIPCTPLANIYSDPGLTQQIANPLTTDSNGNYFFYALPGIYDIQVTPNFGPTQNFPDQVLFSSSSVAASGFFIKSVPTCASNLTFTPGGPISFSVNTAFFLQLNCNVTSSSVGGSPQIGSVMQFSIVNSGGFTFAWPPNFINPPTILSSVGAETDASFWFDGTNWHIQNNNSGAAASGCTPAGFLGDIQSNNGISGCQASSLNDKNGVLNIGDITNVNADFHPKGPNPYFDPTNYGGRAASITGTATITATQTTATLNTTNLLNGDSVILYGAGPAPAVSTLAAPTVSSGNFTTPQAPAVPLAANTASSTYTYCGVADDGKGGLALCSPSTTITNGLVLGQQGPFSVVSSTLNLHTLTLTFSSTPAGIANGTMFIFRNSTDASDFSGVFNVQSQTGTTITAFSVANYCNPQCSSTGGSIKVFNGNPVTFVNNSGASLNRIWVCAQRPGDAGLHVIGVTHPNITYDIGINPAVLTFTDRGANFDNLTAQGPVPGYITDSICTSGSVHNEWLSTSILSGGGTTSVTFANAATNSVTSGFIALDNGPAMVATDAAASAVGVSSGISGVIQIPSNPNRFQFDVYTPVAFHNFVKFQGAITAHEPLFFGSVEGTANSSGPQFSYTGYSGVVCAGAIPCTILNGHGIKMEHMQIGRPNGNGQLLVLVPKPQNVVIRNNNFSTGGVGDYSGICVVYAGGTFNTIYAHNSCTGGPDQVDADSFVPSVYHMTITTAGQLAIIEGDNILSPRGWFMDGTGSFFANIGVTGTIYSQGEIMPVLSQSNAPFGTFSILATIQRDTSLEPAWWLGGNGTPQLGSITCRDISTSSQEAGGFPLPYSGYVGAVCANNINPSVNGAGAIPPSMLAPEAAIISGKAGTLFSRLHQIPCASGAPNAFYGVNLFDLCADNWPAFNVNGSANKYFLASWLSTVSWTNLHCVNVLVGSVTTFGDFGFPCGAFVNGLGTGYQDVTEIATPPNPSAGNERLFANSTTHQLNCITSTGANCAPSGATPAGPALSVQYAQPGLTTFGAIPVPTTPALVPQQIVSTPSVGDVGTAGIFSLAGVPVRASTCPSNADTVKATDRGGYISWSDASTCTVTLPQAGSGSGTDNDFTHNVVFVGCTIGAGSSVITPTTSTISFSNGGSYTSGAATLTLTTGQCALVYSDNTNYKAIVESSNGVTSITADGALYTNSGSTGAVTLTLGQAAANKVWANCTGSTATPTYCSIVANMLPGNGVTTVNGTPCTIGSSCTLPAGTISIANAASVGTTTNTLTKLTGAPSTAVIAATTDIGGVVGICISTCGTTSTAAIQLSGSVSCVFDGATIAGDYVQISSSVAGNCHDTNSATYPITGQIIGRVLSTNGAAGTYTIDLFPSEIKPTNNVVATSNVIGVTSSQSNVSLGSPAAGQYRINYYASQNALCPSGAETVSFAFNWTDAGNARSLTTGTFTLSSAQSSTTGYLSGVLTIQVGSGSVTYSSTFNGSCGGSPSYDIHAALEKIQ